MDLDHFLARVLDSTAMGPPATTKLELAVLERDFYRGALEHIARCIYHEDSKFEDYFKEN